jgi:hypothetical protein
MPMSSVDFENLFNAVYLICIYVPFVIFLAVRFAYVREQMSRLPFYAMGAAVFISALVFYIPFWALKLLLLQILW